MLETISTAVEMALMVLEPTYRTYKELRAVDPTAVDAEAAGAAATRAERRLMVHWIVYVAFRTADWLLRPLQFPCYDAMKIAAAFWLRFGGGAQTLYRSSIRPFLMCNELTADYLLFDRTMHTTPVAEAADAKAADAEVADAEVAAPEAAAAGGR